MTVSLFVP